MYNVDFADILKSVCAITLISYQWIEFTVAKYFIKKIIFELYKVYSCQKRLNHTGKLVNLVREAARWIPKYSIWQISN